MGKRLLLLVILIAPGVFCFSSSSLCRVGANKIFQKCPPVRQRISADSSKDSLVVHAWLKRYEEIASAAALSPEERRLLTVFLYSASVRPLPAEPRKRAAALLDSLAQRYDQLRIELAKLPCVVETDALRCCFSSYLLAASALCHDTENWLDDVSCTDEEGGHPLLLLLLERAAILDEIRKTCTVAETEIRQTVE